MYITAYRQSNIRATDFEHMRELAIQALLNQTEYVEPNHLHFNYPRTITKAISPSAIKVKPEVVANIRKCSHRIATLINRFHELGVHPENSYEQFFIPKSSGGMREINAPTRELADLHHNILWQLKYMNVLTHDSAFAYTPKRNIVDAIKMHQRNESQWFLKIDLKNFFPNCTEELLKQTLSDVYPFMYMHPDVFEQMIKVAMLNGGLPQGSPMSPLLSNLVMVAFDYHMNKTFFDYNKQHFVYTRYADDIILSSKYNFQFQPIVSKIQELLNAYAPGHTINPSKTHYGSRSGRNWNLGLMLNKDNEITLGYKRKRRIKAMLHQFMAQWQLVPVTRTRRTGVNSATTVVETHAPRTTRPIHLHLMSLEENQHIMGMVAYAMQIEPDYWQEQIRKLEVKLNVTYDECRRNANKV